MTDDADAGYGVAQRLGKSGATVALVDLDKPQLHTVQAELQAQGIPCSAYHVDVSNHSQVHQCVQDIAQKHGKIDVLVSAAGMIANVSAEGTKGSPARLPSRHIRWMWTISNVYGM